MNSCRDPIPYTHCYTAKNGDSFAIRPASPADGQRIEENINNICAEKEFLHTDRFVRTGEWESLLTRSIDLDKRRLLLVAVAEADGLVGSQEQDVGQSQNRRDASPDQATAREPRTCPRTGLRDLLVQVPPPMVLRRCNLLPVYSESLP